MKKWGFLMFFVVLLVFVTAACSSNKPAGEGAEKPQGTNESTKSTPDNTAKHPSYYSEAPATVSLFIVNNQSWPYQKTWPIWKWVKDSTNITIEGIVPAGDDVEALNLAMASGDVADIVFTRPISANKFGQQGALVDLNKHLDKMPNLKKYWAEHPDLKALSTDPTGANYMVSNSEVGYGNQRAWMFREDIFKKHELTAPTNWDELYTVAKKLKALYPDSFPLVFRSQIEQLEVFGAGFETANYMYPDPKTGKVRYGAVENNYKKLVEILHKFSEEKLIPPNWLSMNANQWNEHIVNNQSFITVDFIGRIDSFNILMKGTGAHFKFMAPPAGWPGGKQYILDGNYNVSGFAVYAKSKNIDAALKYIDFLYSDAGKEMMSWGVEGETFEVKNGQRVYKSEFSDFTKLRKDIGMVTNGTYGRLNLDAMLQFTPVEERYVYSEAPKYAFPVKIIPPAFDSKEQEQLTTVYASIQKYTVENIAKFIMGSKPLTEWDAYVEQTNKLGLQKMIDLFQVAWDRQ
jgi:putative aldouronate transport system substrate-binding protein